MSGESGTLITKPATTSKQNRKEISIGCKYTRLQYKSHIIGIMEGKTRLYSEITNCNFEAEYVLFSLKGLLRHLDKVESTIYYFSDIMSYHDFQRVCYALRTLKRFLKFVLSFATINKRTLPRAIKGTFV